MRKILIAGVAAAGLLALSAPALAGTGGEQPPAGVVSNVPAKLTPHLKASDNSPVQQVRQLAQCGGTMYAVGTFPAMIRGSTTYARNNVMSFSATSPFGVSAWNPNVNGIVNSIAFTPNCSVAYLGGKFTTVGGVAAKNIAAVSTSTGAVVSTFARSASGQVETLQYYNGHLLTGGYFSSVNGSSTKYMVSLNPTTGKDDGFIRLGISGNYQFPGVGSNPTRVYNQQLSPSGTLDLVEGDFTSVGGQARQQMFMLNLGGAQATVTGWNAPELNTNCNFNEAFYAQTGAWSPNGSTVYTATTGYKPNGTPAGSYPRTGPCDALIAYPATQTTVSHKWISYPGCDSLFSVAAASNAVYAGGHERWAMNPLGCDFAGPGSYPAPGMEGADPANGNVYINTAGTAGYYKRARGEGADDMLLTSAGLWIASDNAHGSDTCGGVAGHSGICFLP